MLLLDEQLFTSLILCEWNSHSVTNRTRTYAENITYDKRTRVIDIVYRQFESNQYHIKIHFFSFSYLFNFSAAIDMQ